jgi:hypothetical protein
MKMRNHNKDLNKRLQKPEQQKWFMMSVFNQCKSDPQLLNQLNAAESDEWVRVIKNMMNTTKCWCVYIKFKWSSCQYKLSGFWQTIT